MQTDELLDSYYALWKNIMTKLFVIFVITTVALSVIINHLENSHKKRLIDSKLSMLAELVYNVSIDQVIVRDKVALNTTINNLLGSLPEISSVEITTETGEVLLKVAQSADENGNISVISKPYTISNQVFGKATLVCDINKLNLNFDDFSNKIQLFMLGSIAVLFFIFFFYIFKRTSPYFKGVVKQALHDTLTKLPNRCYFNHELEKQISLLERSNGTTKLALLFFDLDKFKFVNDHFGHYTGDELLIAFSNRVTKAIRKNDFLARLGGDEFVLILTDIKNKQQIDSILKNIYLQFREPVKLSSVNWQLNFSVGVTITSNPFISSRQLLNQADSALYKAKSDNKGRWLYHDKKEKLIISIADDPTAQVKLKGFLREHKDYELITESTALAGLTSILQFKPNLIIVSLVANTDEIINLLRVKSEFKATPIILITDQEATTADEATNTQDYVLTMKTPLDYSELYKIIEDTLT